jgi:hypothetical protein
VGNGQFFFKKFGTTIDTTGLQLEKYQRGLLLSESRALRTLSSVGLTAVIDVGFELYEFGSGTGQWGNPYLTTGQKTFPSITVIGSDLLLAGGLAFSGAAWYVTVPVAFAWALIADPVFSNAPFTSRFYDENRNLQPLN